DLAERSLRDVAGGFADELLDLAAIRQSRRRGHRSAELPDALRELPSPLERGQKLCVDLGNLLAELVDFAALVAHVSHQDSTKASPPRVFALGPRAASRYRPTRGLLARARQPAAKVRANAGSPS